MTLKCLDTAERLHQVGNIFFSLSALEQQDPRAWYLSQTIALRKAGHWLNVSLIMQHASPFTRHSLCTNPGTDPNKGKTVPRTT